MGGGFSIGASIVASVTLFVAAAIFWVQGRGGSGTGAAARALKDLLRERAAGRLSAEEFDIRQAQLHAALLESPPAHLGRIGAALGIAGVVAAGIGAYLYATDPGALAPAASHPSASTAPGPAPAAGAKGAPEDARQGHAGDMRELVKRLAEKLEKDPSNGEGWILLGKSYLELGQHKEAADAFAKAIKLVPTDATLLADYADAHVMANARKWDAPSKDAIAKALAADPRHLKSLALAGSEAFDRKDFKVAIEFWERMLAAAPPGSPEAKQAQGNIAEARSLASAKP